MAIQANAHVYGTKCTNQITVNIFLLTRKFNHFIGSDYCSIVLNSTKHTGH